MLEFPFLQYRRRETFIPVPVYGDGYRKFAGGHCSLMLTEQSVAAFFLEALAVSPEQAMAFVSKNSVHALDLESLRDALGSGAGRLCKWVVKAPYAGEPKDRPTRSLVVIGPEGRARRLLHLHMVKEPDQYGPWKICGVEQE